MIQLTCAQCQATLEVDDAFAGGVCRCQHCGTIQTVPKAGEVHAEAGSRALYQVQSRANAAGATSGLEELAEVIHSSGLAGSGLRHRAGQREIPVAQEVKKSRLPVIIGSVVAALLLLAIATAAVVMLKSRRATETLPDGSVAPAAADTSTPNFAGVAISGERVIFVLDRGDATSDYFSDLKVLTDRAVRSMGDSKKFQVTLWDNGSVDSYPALGPNFCTADEAGKLDAWFDEVPTGRPTDLMPALKAAVAQSPDTIFLVTAKSNLADNATFAADVLGELGGKKIVIHTITLGQGSPDDPLKKISLETGGKNLILSRSDADRLAG